MAELSIGEMAGSYFFFYPLIRFLKYVTPLRAVFWGGPNREEGGGKNAFFPKISRRFCSIVDTLGVRQGWY